MASARHHRRWQVSFAGISRQRNRLHLAICEIYTALWRRTGGRCVYTDLQRRCNRHNSQRRQEQIKSRDNFSDLIDDPEEYARYNPKYAYVKQPRARLKDAQKIRNMLPMTGLYPFDEDPELFHSLVLSFHSSLKEIWNKKKHTTHWFGHCLCPTKTTPKGVKIRGDVRRSAKTTA